MDNVNNSTLVLVQVVFRHGIRAPDYLGSCPGDSYKNVKYDLFGTGPLTKDGRKQAYEFGKELRAQYNDFLGPDFHDSILEAHSSEVGRARTSLQLVLAGLFPPTETTKITDDLNWHPILYNYQPLQQDPLMGSMIRQLMSTVNHKEFKKSPNSIDVISQIEEKLKWKIEHASQLMMIYDILRVQTDLGMECPDWAKDIFPDKIREEVKCHLVSNMAREGYLKEGAGGLVHKILTEMEKKAVHENNDAEPKIILYSGHDINLFAVMKILRFPQVVWPNYIGCLIFELHNFNGEFYVKINFRDGYLNESDKSKRISCQLTLTIPTTDNAAWKLPELRSHVSEYIK